MNVALSTVARHHGGMRSIRIDVPEEVYAVFTRRANEHLQPVEEYVRERLIEDARRPTLDEILDRAGRRIGGSVRVADAVETRRRDRFDR